MTCFKDTPHDAVMKTTLSLDRDVAERLAEEARRTGRDVETVASIVLRAGLGLPSAPGGDKEAPVPPFRVVPHDFGFREGIDLNKMNRLADELEIEEMSRKLGRVSGT